MRLYRFALIAFATVLVSVCAARPASAASYQLCLALDGESSEYFLNFMIQGNGVLVAGNKGHGGQDDHDPVFGALSRAPETPQIMEMGLTVTFANGATTRIRTPRMWSSHLRRMARSPTSAGSIARKSSRKERQA
jgi:hypothetical protein